MNHLRPARSSPRAPATRPLARSARAPRVIAPFVLLILTACGSDVDPQPQPEEEPRAETPTEVLAVMEKAECLDCHVLDGRGIYEGPTLNRVGGRLSSDQIRRKIVNPASFPAAGYENLAGRMPTDFEERLTTEELDRLVDYLAQRQ